MSRDAWPGDPASSQSQNRYSYAANNPATLVDPSGHCGIDAVADVGFAAVSAATLLFGPEKDRGINAIAFGADVTSVFIPCATGLGMLVRAGKAIDNVGDAVTGGARISDLGMDVARQVDEAIARARTGTIRFPGHDGKRFDNLAGVLPRAEPGYYTEWTAAASGAKRGPHRVIVGGDPTSPDVIFYWNHERGYVQVFP